MTKLMNTSRPIASETLKFGFMQPPYLIGIVLLLGCLGWAYWPTIVETVAAWSTEPDYSHGYIVVPVAIAFLWIRRDRFPEGANRPAIFGGLAIVAASILDRYFGARFYLGAFDGWSLILWIGGVVVTLAGWRRLWWSLPSIVFLFFMIPMPYRLENMFRQPLQYLATKISCAILVMLGQPAIAEGNTIRIGDVQFGIVEACSGLRIFVGIVALAFAYIVVVRRHWLIRGLLLLMVLPVTICANSTRIVVTCLLYTYVSGEAAKKFSHDLAGFVMIPFAAVLLGLLLWYLGHLIFEIRLMSVSEVFRQPADTTDSLQDSAS